MLEAGHLQFERVSLLGGRRTEVGKVVKQVHLIVISELMSDTLSTFALAYAPWHPRTSENGPIRANRFGERPTSVRNLRQTAVNSSPLHLLHLQYFLFRGS